MCSFIQRWALSWLSCILYFPQTPQLALKETGGPNLGFPGELQCLETT